MARLLIVEDHVDLGELLGEVLAEEGFDIERTFDGVSAWRRLQRLPAVDLVLTDARLPGLSGTELVERMRQSARLRRVPVILTTGAPLAERPQGAAALLHKPLDLEELLATVARLVLPQQAAAGLG